MEHWGRSLGRDMHVISPQETSESWWIDDRGQWRPCYDGQGRVILSGGADACHKDKAIAFRIFGMVYCEAQANEYYFAWDIVKASSDALNTVIQWLFALEPDASINLSYDYGGWTHHKSLCPKRALSVVRATLSYKDAVPIGFVRTARKKLSSLNAQHPFHGLVKAWARAAGFSKNFYANHMSYLLDHGVLMSPQEETGNFQVRHIGSASVILQILDREHIMQSLGKTLAQSPVADLYYEREIGKSYLDVLRHWRPRLDDVMALMHLPDREAEWVPYRRLLLPIRSELGQRSVVILTDLDSHISIPCLDIPLEESFAELPM